MLNAEPIIAASGIDNDNEMYFHAIIGYAFNNMKKMNDIKNVIDYYFKIVCIFLYIL